MSTATLPNKQKQQSIDEKLHAFFYLLQEDLDKFKAEVEKSYDLFRKIGKKTELTQLIEENIKNPSKGFFANANEVNQVAFAIVNAQVIMHFKSNNEIIYKGIRIVKRIDDSLRYYIVLKKDSQENRRKIYSFFDKYAVSELSNKFPVYIEFIPKELAGKINVDFKEINLK
jgi:hypothetical protein